MAAVERITIPFPKGFDPSKHIKAIPGLIAKQYGAGFDEVHVDHESKTIIASRSVEVSEVTKNEANDSFDVRLGPDLKKPSAGEKAAAKFEDQYPGYFMTGFEPFLGKATLSPLTDDEARCRGALAVALGCKPWDVGVKSDAGGGFVVDLPKNYVPSKHDAKLDEVATTAVGREGWYVDVDVAKLVARIVPSEPPTFPAAFPTELAELGRGDIDRTPFARALPQPGEEIGPEVSIDWTDSAWALLAGTPGSGKSVALLKILADQVSNGAELVVIDDKSKAVDFEMFKPFVRDHGWGCDSLEAAAAALGLVREEGERRARVLKQMGLNNWMDMPAGQRFAPILIIFDEVSAVLVPDPPLKGIPKDHPLYLENERTNVSKALIGSFATKIIAELRFVGIRMVMSTQATNNNTGVGPSTRTKMGHFILQGVNPSKAARNQIFADESTVPTVPENVKAGGPRARGVGVADLGGQAPVVYKTYFASPAAYAEQLNKLGVPTTSSPAPTASQIDRFLPTLEDERDNQPAARRGDADVSPVSGRSLEEIGKEMGDPMAGGLVDPETGEKLRGFEKANRARHLTAQAAKQTRPAAKPELADNFE